MFRRADELAPTYDSLEPGTFCVLFHESLQTLPCKCAYPTEHIIGQVCPPTTCSSITNMHQINETHTKNDSPFVKSGRNRQDHLVQLPFQMWQLQPPGRGGLCGATHTGGSGVGSRAATHHAWAALLNSQDSPALSHLNNAAAIIHRSSHC